MPTYLPTQDVLNVSVSCFTNYDTPANPVTINLITWLRSTKHRAKIEALRLEPDKSQRDTLKATLPAITPSGVFTYRREANLIQGRHTRLIQFDIDLKDNPHIRNYDDLKEQISKLPIVAYCGLSASGKGYWGLVVIAEPERHSQHFDALKRVFAHYGIHIDTKPRNVASLRGYSYDPAPYLPKRVEVFELFDVPAPPPKRDFNRTTDVNTEQERVEVCIQEVLRRSTYVGNSYNDWYAVGCSLAKTFGEAGRDYFHHVSQHYPGYQPGATDKQFTACLKARSQATLGTFFHLCKQIGIEWNELLPVPKYDHRTDKTKVPTAKGHIGGLAVGTIETTPVYVKTRAEQTARPGAILQPDESQVERLTVDPCDTYPAEWDEPNAPDAVPTIRPVIFFEWQ